MIFLTVHIADTINKTLQHSTIIYNAQVLVDVHFYCAYNIQIYSQP